MKKRMILSLGSKLLFLSVFTGLMSACGGGQTQQQQQQGVAVSTLKITPTDISLDRKYPASLKGKTDIEIHPQVSGFITKVLVDEGQAVTKGQVLFTIDQVQLEAAVRSAESQVIAAKSAVSTSQLTANNKKTLYSKNIISDYEYQTAVLALESAKAQLNQAQQALVNAKKNLSFANVTAPSNGFVGAIPNREGSLVSPSSQALTTISDISEVYAYFSLNEKEMLALTDSGKITLNQAIKQIPEVGLLLANGTRYPFTGKISTLSGVIDNATGSASVRAIFKNDNNMIRSGSTGTILIPEPSKNQILVPQNATFEIQDKKFVYIVNDSSKAVSKAIKISPVNDGKNYVVTDGLKTGDVIVIEGVGTQVKEGALIIPNSNQAQEAKQDK